MTLLDHFNLDNRRTLGLDVGNASVKAVQLGKANGKYFIKSCSHVPVDNDADQDEQASQANITAAIRKCVDRCGTRTPYAVCAVNGPDITVRGFNFVNTPKQQIGWAILQEAKQVCPLEMEQSIIDYQVTRQSQDRNVRAGLLVASLADLVFEKTRQVKKAGMQNVLMDVNSIALLNCFQAFSNQAKDQTCVLLDIGKNFTNLIIVSDTAPPFVRSINSAGKDIIKRVAGSMNTTDAAVEDTLRQNENAQLDRQKFTQSLASALYELTNQVQETLAYYRTHQQQCRISKVYICGGFALGMGVEDMLNTQLLEPVEIWNPLKDIPFNQNGHETSQCIENGPAMAVALGLAMRSI